MEVACAVEEEDDGAGVGVAGAAMTNGLPLDGVFYR